jgi:hypothetical protein
MSLVQSMAYTVPIEIPDPQYTFLVHELAFLPLLDFYHYSF